MAWMDRVLVGHSAGHNFLLLLVVAQFVVLTDCSPTGNRGIRGQGLLQGGHHVLGEEVLATPAGNLHQLNPNKNIGGPKPRVAEVRVTGVPKDVQEGTDGAATGREPDVSGGAELLEHLLQSGSSLRRRGSTSEKKSRKQSASRDLLNALREHRHQRFQQLERLQTVPEPEMADDSRGGRNEGTAAGIVSGGDGLIPPPGAVSPEALGLLPSLMVPISRGRGGGGHNLILQGHKDNMDVIKGSRRAFNVTKLEYLKKEWCKTERFRQVVREEGCLRREIINRFCYGQCNSFFIPKSNKHDPNSAAFRSCAFCRPRRTFSVTVTMICPARRQRLLRKKVDVVKQCKCMAQRFDN